MVHHWSAQDSTAGLPERDGDFHLKDEGTTVLHLDTTLVLFLSAFPLGPGKKASKVVSLCWKNMVPSPFGDSYSILGAGISRVFHVGAICDHQPGRIAIRRYCHTLRCYTQGAYPYIIYLSDFLFYSHLCWWTFIRKWEILLVNGPQSYHKLLIYHEKWMAYQYRSPIFLDIKPIRRA